MSARYTSERLAEAALHSQSFDDAVIRCGGTPTPGSRQYIRKKMAEAGIDASHFNTRQVRHTAAKLRETVSRSHSIAEVVRRLGLSPVGGNQAHIGRRIAKLSIDTSHFTPRSSRQKRATRERMALGSPADGRVPGQRLKKELVKMGVPEECNMCGTGTEWNGKPLRLEVDHINGEWWDNRPANLRLLCPNCHSVTDTYRGRRKRRSSGPRP